MVEVLRQLDTVPPDATAADALGSLLGASDAPSSAEEIAWAFRKTLEHAAADRPLAVVFDDVHSGEETFLDLVEHVGSALVRCTLAAPLPGTARAGRAAAGVAGDAPARAAARRGRRAADPRSNRRARCASEIAGAAGGNPLFIGEMLAMAASDGEAVVPPTLQALLAARLDGLESAERAVLECGAVEGEVFHRGSVQALVPDEPQVTPQLAGLVRKQLIAPDRAQIPGEDGFRFRHLLMRDAAYDALPKARAGRAARRVCALARGPRRPHSSSWTSCSGTTSSRPFATAGAGHQRTASSRRPPASA